MTGDGDTETLPSYRVNTSSRVNINMLICTTDQTRRGMYSLFFTQGVLKMNDDFLYVENCEVVDTKLLTKQAFSRCIYKLQGFALPVPVLSLETFGRCRFIGVGHHLDKISTLY